LHNNNYQFFLEDIRMSNGEHDNNEAENTPVEEENTPTKTDSNAVSNVVSSLLALKESNPKVFFGGIGGVVVVLIFLIVSGGSDKKLPIHKATTIVTGQNYVLHSANAADPSAPIRLVSIPGSLAAFDDTEEEDRSGCKRMPPNTPVKALQTQDAYGKKDAFVQVEMTTGECQGRKGWVLAINVK
jgi:hypothetical protein